MVAPQRSFTLAGDVATIERGNSEATRLLITSLLIPKPDAAATAEGKGILVLRQREGPQQERAGRAAKMWRPYIDAEHLYCTISCA